MQQGRAARTVDFILRSTDPALSETIVRANQSDLSLTAVQIAQLNKKKTELEAALATPEIYNDKSKFTQAENDYKNAAAELKQLNAEYEIVFEKVMELEEKMG